MENLHQFFRRTHNMLPEICYLLDLKKLPSTIDTQVKKLLCFQAVFLPLEGMNLA